MTFESFALLKSSPLPPVGQPAVRKHQLTLPGDREQAHRHRKASHQLWEAFNLSATREVFCGS